MHVLAQADREHQAPGDDDDRDAQRPNRSRFAASGNLPLFVVFEMRRAHELRALRLLVRFFDDFLRAGTLPPARRASERPMAMACLRLVTFLPERPERGVPLFISFMLRSTLLLAFLP